MSGRKGAMKGEGRTSRERLLMAMQGKMSQLQSAITNVSLTKKRLRNNVQEVKSEIHSSVGRQLEVLRTREVHLLNQVEVIETAKDQLLSHQEDALHQALGGLQSLSAADENSRACGGGTAILNQISQSLEGLDSLDLYPEDQADIVFSADTLSLRESIRGFGQVLSSPTTPTLGPFSMPDEGAASLPKPFEEYEDEEQQVLYKSLQSNTSSINVTIPNMALKPQDWLFLPTHVPEKTVPADEEPTFVFPPFQASEMSQWLARSGAADSVSSSASLHLWLQDLQHQSLMEEEDTGGFEILARTPQTPSTPLLPETDLQESTVHSFPVFQQVAAAPVTAWLLTPGSVMMEQDEEPVYSNPASQYLSNMSTDIKHWLLEYQENHTDQVESLLTSSCSGACSKAGSPVGGQVDIESLSERLLCAVSTIKTNTEEGDDDRDVDEGETTLRLCKANEPCRSFDECLSDENCCSEQSDSVVNPWLMPRSHVEVCSTEFPNFDRICSQDTNEWLKCDVTVSDSGESGVDMKFSPFERSASLNVWLSGTGEVPSGEAVSSTSPDISEWLSPYSENDPDHSCPSFQNLAGIAKSDTKSWLLKDSNDVDEKDLGEENLLVQKDELSKWLHCSVQCNEARSEKNVGIMRLKENYARWLLPEMYQEKVKELPEVMENLTLCSSQNVISNNEVFQCFKEASNSLNMSHWLIGGAR